MRFWRRKRKEVTTTPWWAMSQEEALARRVVNGVVNDRADDAALSRATGRDYGAERPMLDEIETRYEGALKRREDQQWTPATAARPKP